MFGIDLVVTVTLDDLSGTLCGLLGAFGKTVKSHHKKNPFSKAAIHIVMLRRVLCDEAALEMRGDLSQKNGSE